MKNVINKTYMSSPYFIFRKKINCSKLKAKSLLFIWQQCISTNSVIVIIIKPNITLKVFNI